MKLNTMTKKDYNNSNS